MWKGYEEALGAYGRATFVRCGVRWVSSDTTWDSITAELNELGITVGARAGRAPSRWERCRRGSGDPALHDSHRAALLLKDSEHYRPLFPQAPDDVPYHWPVRSRQGDRSRSVVKRVRLRNGERRRERPTPPRRGQFERSVRRRSTVGAEPNHHRAPHGRHVAEVSNLRVTVVASFGQIASGLACGTPLGRELISDENIHHPRPGI